MTISGKFFDMAYRELMPTNKQEQATEEAAAYVYSLIKGYDNFMNLEEAINAYSAATEREGFKAGFRAGLKMMAEILGENEQKLPGGPMTKTEEVLHS